MSQRLMSVSVRNDLKRAVVEMQHLRDDVANKAAFRALNRALDKVATETGREIRKVYNVRQRAITSALRKRRANRNSLTARLLVEGVRLGLVEFAARAVNPWNVRGRGRRKRGGGVSVQVKVQGGRKLVASAFLAAATANNAQGGGSAGMRQVWSRMGAERLPIKTLRSLSVPQAFANDAVLRALQVFAKETFDKNLQQQIRFLTR